MHAFYGNRLRAIARVTFKGKSVATVEIFGSIIRTTTPPVASALLLLTI